MKEGTAWISKGLILPFLALWVFLSGVIIAATWNAPRPFFEYAFGPLLILVPIFLFVSPLVLVGFYLRKIRGKFPFLAVGLGEQLEKCPLCAEPMVREKFTNNLFLLPYAFKRFRHFEKRHDEIGIYARKARLAGTASVHMILLLFPVIVGSRSLGPAGTDFLQNTVRFLIPFLSLYIVGLALIRRELVSKRGAFLEGRATGPAEEKVSTLERVRFGRTLTFAQDNWQSLLQYSLVMSIVLGIIATAARYFRVTDLTFIDWNLAITLLPGVLMLAFLYACLGILVALAQSMKQVDELYKDRLQQGLGDKDRYSKVWKEKTRSLEMEIFGRLRDLNPLLLVATAIVGFLSILYSLVSPPLPPPFYALYPPQVILTFFALVTLIEQRRLGSKSGVLSQS